MYQTVNNRYAKNIYFFTNTIKNIHFHGNWELGVHTRSNLWYLINDTIWWRYFWTFRESDRGKYLQEQIEKYKETENRGEYIYSIEYDIYSYFIIDNTTR